MVDNDRDHYRLAHALWHLGACYRSLERHDDARSIYELLLTRREPEFARWHGGAHAYLGAIYHRWRDYERAAAEFEVVLRDYAADALAPFAARELEEMRHKIAAGGAP